MKSSDQAPIVLAGTDLKISPLGLGTFAWGDKATWGMEGYDSSFNFDTIRQAFQSSLSRGITLLDTAEIYGSGESERIIGQLLAEQEANNRVVVATKFFPAPWKLSVASALMTSLRASLKRLRMPSVPLYQIHGPVSLRSHRAMAEALADPYHQGLIQAVGVSNYSKREVLEIHAQLKRLGVPLASNQVEYSLLRTMPETSGLLQTCCELNVAVLAYSPLGQGRLTGKYSVHNPPQGRREFSDYPMQEIDPVVTVLNEIGQRLGGKTPAQVALNWVMCKGAIPIPGAKTREQAEQNAGALGWSLSNADMETLNAVSKSGQRRLKHRWLQHG